MNAYSITVTIASEPGLDVAEMTDFINASVEEKLGENCLVTTQPSGVKHYSEQGWKVARNRKFGIVVKEAGDAHKATLVVESAKADAILPGV